MTEAKVGFKIPATRRILRLLRSEQLAVSSVRVAPDGSVCLEILNEPAGEDVVHTVADEAAA
jgi:hypothetical protein